MICHCPQEREMRESVGEDSSISFQLVRQSPHTVHRSEKGVSNQNSQQSHRNSVRLEQFLWRRDTSNLMLIKTEKNPRGICVLSSPCPKWHSLGEWQNNHKWEKKSVSYKSMNLVKLLSCSNNCLDCTQHSCKLRHIHHCYYFVLFKALWGMMYSLFLLNKVWKKTQTFFEVVFSLHLNNLQFQ